MSKIVTIPNWQTPFVVNINDTEYTYTPGETVEVPDEVATIIEQAVAAHKPPSPEIVPPFAGGHSWNDLEDRPFGETVEFVNAPLTVTWDGNTDGLVSVDLGDGVVLYKISDSTPTLIEAQHGGSAIYNNGGALSFTSETIIAPNDTIYCIFNVSVALVALEDNADMFGMTIPKKGVYFGVAEGRYLSSLTTNASVPHLATVAHRMDEKYMPLLTDANGVQYKLTVNTDGTLSAVAV